MISGGHTVYTGNEGVSQGWFITGTVTEYSWQQGHESAPHRQTGHCYLAGRSWLSPLISAVRSEENTSHQCIFTQPRVLEGACTQNMMILYFLYLFSLRNTVFVEARSYTNKWWWKHKAWGWVHICDASVSTHTEVRSSNRRSQWLWTDLWDRLLELLNTKSSGRRHVRGRPFTKSDEKYMYKFTFGDRLWIMWHSKPEEKDCQWVLGILLKNILETRLEQGDISFTLNFSWCDWLLSTCLHNTSPTCVIVIQHVWPKEQTSTSHMCSFHIAGWIGSFAHYTCHT